MLPTDLAGHLARHHADFLAGRSQRARRLRGAAEALGVLPVLHQWGRDYGVRVEDGEVVSFNAGEPHDLAVETDKRVRTLVLGYAQAAHPDLAPLVPPRSPGARDCPQCGGRGGVARPNGGRGVCPGCGGLGWSIPPMGA